MAIRVTFSTESYQIIHIEPPVRCVTEWDDVVDILGGLLAAILPAIVAQWVFGPEPLGEYPPLMVIVLRPPLVASLRLTLIAWNYF